MPLYIIQMYLYCIIVCSVLQYYTVNISCCHLLNTKKKKHIIIVTCIARWQAVRTEWLSDFDL